MFKNAKDPTILIRSFYTYTFKLSYTLAQPPKNVNALSPDYC